STPIQTLAPALRGPSPLWAVQSVVFLASMGTGVVTNGIFFIAKESSGFTPRMNFALGSLLGVMYILGAAGVGPTLRRMAARSPRVSSRGVLAGLSITLGLAAMVPPAVAFFVPERAAAGVWLGVALYAPCSGAFWPIVESYLGGGRSGHPLRRAIGQFNVIWALAVLLSLWAMAPLLDRMPLGVLLVFGVLQLASTALLIPMGREPGRHLPEHLEPHPPVYVPLLTTFRLLLPTSYFVVSIWSPYAPDVLDRLAVDVGWQTPVAATWMLSRFVVFIAMERWHGWHGRWWLVAVGAVGMVGGIGIALAAPLVGGPLGVGLLLAGLALLGIGNGVIYVASLYYAMEVGAGEVEAGGTHEALIGMGFAGGPLTGLLAVGAVRSGVLPPGVSLNIAMLLTLGVVLAVVGLVLVRRVVRAVRRVEAPSA
ncbi:MAG: hypothetical protein ACF8LK_00435, partial [Phycisphaerales bacterium JB041]